jgi:hypothetical protein
LDNISEVLLIPFKWGNSTKIYIARILALLNARDLFHLGFVRNTSGKCATEGKRVCYFNANEGE